MSKRCHRKARPVRPAVCREAFEHRLGQLEIHDMAIGELRPNPRNARTHSRTQIAQIVASIREFGFCNPILIDEKDRIIAGHGRLEAAGELGMTLVPVIRIAGLSESQKTALAVADNRIAEHAAWDEELLALEIGSLVGTEIDLTVTGFEMGEIDLLLQMGEDGPALEGDDEIPEVEAGATVTRPADLWLIDGRHRLLCGDARDPAAYDRLLDGKTASLCFTDPPYNVAIGGHVSGLGRTSSEQN